MKSAPEPSIFSVMSKLAMDCNAINLAQGFPNFPIDPTLNRLISEASQQPVHQYAPYQGTYKLRHEIKKLIFNFSGTEVNEDEILITAGATQAIYTAIQALVSSQEEVVLLDPCYDCYETPVKIIGALPIRVELNDNFQPDWDKIRAHVSMKTRLIIINSPHNPSGTVWDKAEYEKLEALLKDFPNLRVLSDEVYEYLTFDKIHYSVRDFSYLKARSVVVSSFGKSLQATGWKIGYLTAPQDIMNEILGIHQFLVFSVNSIMQEGIANYLPQFDVAKIQEAYKQRKMFFQAALKSSRFSLLPCHGTYFQTVGFDNVSSMNDVEFCKWLTKEKGVAAIPLSVFYQTKKDRKQIRLCFAKDEQTLKRSAELLCKI